MSLYVLIPLLPFFAFLAIAVGGRQLGEGSQRIGIPAMALSFALAVVACVDVFVNGPIAISLYTLMQSGTLTIDVGLYFDQLSVLLLLLVTGISALVHVYSSRYMQGDARYARFFALISLFTFSMIMLLLSNNLLVVLVFWEVMGICSYFLIGFWAERISAVRAATKAFLVNAVADIGLGFGIILTFATFGTLDIRQIIAAATEHSADTVNLLSLAGGEWHVASLTVICFFLFVGAMGKSAQLPFHGWLPSAMEAPTPVSALIHAATMVNAGIYLIIRLSPVFVLAPSVMTFIAVVGGATALFAAVVALTQTDIKRILAFSTISQLGFMMLVCGVGAFAAAVFHLLAHGVLKAYLFLSTGNALKSVATHHATHRVPTPPWNLSIWALVFACLPPLILFSGPYERLWTAVLDQPAGWIFFALGGMTVFFTAYYLFGLIASIFQHPTPVEWDIISDPLDPRPTLASPAMIAAVAIATLGLGAALMFVWDRFAHALAPVLGSEVLVTRGADDPAVNSLWIIASLAIALAGWGFAYYLHLHPYRPPLLGTSLSKTMYVLCLNRWYADELYQAMVVRPTLGVARWLSQVVEIKGIDRMVNAMGRLSISLANLIWKVVELGGINRTVNVTGNFTVKAACWLLNVVEIRGIDRAVDGIGHQADSTGQTLRKADRPLIQQQMLVMIFWLVMAIILFYWIVL
ncbi:MAG TPA: NADH-quinone oxidoreductase subunit L [Nitrospirales bacterium]|nr:NADH-quinone oxidoreductase subunit L [Nitrospirales bacterium]